MSVSDPGRGERSGPGRRRGSRVLAPDELRQAIEELVDELIDRDIPARLTIYGGAGMALVHYERAATMDIDASFLPSEAVSDAASAVAARRGLADDWLNNAATAFLPPVPDDHPAPIVIDRGDVVVTVASAELLLAMKLRASRPGRDGDDIAVLVRACGVRSVVDAQQLMDEIYLGEEQIPARGLALLDRALGEVEIRLATGTTVLPAVGDDMR